MVLVSKHKLQLTNMNKRAKSGPWAKYDMSDKDQHIQALKERITNWKERDVLGQANPAGGEHVEQFVPIHMIPASTWFGLHPLWDDLGDHTVQAEEARNDSALASEACSMRTPMPNDSPSCSTSCSGQPDPPVPERAQLLHGQPRHLKLVVQDRSSSGVSGAGTRSSPRRTGPSRDRAARNRSRRWTRTGIRRRHPACAQDRIEPGGREGVPGQRRRYRANASGPRPPPWRPHRRGAGNGCRRRAASCPHAPQRPS